MDLAILKAEIDNGLYKKPIEVLAKEFQYGPLPGEVRAVIIAAWRRGVCCRRRPLSAWCLSKPIRACLTLDRGR